MKFAVFSLMEWSEDRSQSDLFHHALDQLVLAEQQGYDAAWLAEHHRSRHGIGPAIHLAAAHLAARTSRIRIGAAVAIVPFLHPLRIAEEVAVLDIMSNGRIDWAAGSGYPQPHLAGSGQDIEHSHAVFGEQLAIILRAWSGDRFSFEGEFFRFPELQCFPVPVQQPHPPVWIAARSSSTFEWAGENGHRVLTDAFCSVSAIEENRRLYGEALARSGVDWETSALPTLRQLYVGETTKKAREQAAPALLQHYRSLLAVDSPGPYRDPDALLDFLFEQCAVVGDEAYCREKLAELRERIGLEYLLTWQNFGNLPHEASMASQRRFIEKVAPAFN